MYKEGLASGWRRAGSRPLAIPHDAISDQSGQKKCVAFAREKTGRVAISI
jgi:hypothetical protein